MSEPGATFVNTVTLAALLVLSLAGPLTDAEAGQGETVTGRLAVSWGDPLPTAGVEPRMSYVLTADDGRRLEMDISGRVLATAGGTFVINGQRVVVELGTERTAGSGRPEHEVVSLRAEFAAKAARAAVVGQKTYLNLLCKFPDVAAEPADTAYFTGMFGPDYPGLDHYWREVSYDTVSIASAAHGWRVLPQPRSAYVTGTEGQCGDDVNANLSLLFTDCVGLFDGDIDFSAGVDGINLIFNSELDCYAWGGSRCETLDGVYACWPTTWEPPWGYGNQAVLAHEMGHSFGLPHSNNSDQDDDPYDNPWDVMSSTWTFNPSAPPYGVVAQHTLSYHKQLLGWIPDPAVYTPTNGSSLDFQLERLALPQNSGYLMASIPVTDTLSYTVEARRFAGYDSHLPGQGVIIHTVDPTREEPAWLVEEDPATGAGDAGEWWAVGETYVDSQHNISIEVSGETASAYTVTVKFCGNGTVDPGEQCDDGNNTSSDGCSAGCNLETVQDKKQQKCINALLKGGAGVATAKGILDADCVKKTGKGQEADADVCISTDAKGKVSRASAKAIKLEQKGCAVQPDFAYAPGATVVADALWGGGRLLYDILAPVNALVDAAIVRASVDKAAAVCQATVIKLSGKIVKTKLKAFGKCAKNGLKGTGAGLYMISADGLSNCFVDSFADPAGKTAKAVAKLKRALVAKCLTVDRAAAFPGSCLGATGYILSLRDCIKTQVDSRAIAIYDWIGP